MDNVTDSITTPPRMQDLLSQNEMLKAQLISASMTNELVKVLHSCTDLEGIVKTVLLSFQDLVNFDRVILFAINSERFRLEPRYWVGIDDDDVKKLAIPLGFEGGDITDAIFLNRHIFVEEPDHAGDPFSLELQSSSYIVVPLLRKPTRKCWELKGCAKKSCNCYGSVNPYCWSNMGAHGDDTNITEDDRRRRCLSCAAFKVEGMFWLDRKGSTAPITSDDISNITNIITLAGLMFENFRMINALDAANHELTNTNETLRRVNHDLEIAESKIRLDLEQARSIQHRLLPDDIRNAEEGYDISSRYLAANTVGGDYYDLFKIADDTYGIVVADVSGHGVASALIMSMVKILLRAYSKDGTSPQKTLERINEVFISEIATEHFVTIFYAVFDVKARKLRFTSAGHCPILYMHKGSGECEQFRADGLFLGIFPDMMLTEREIDYTPGEHRLILYTDGLTESVNASDEMYGIERLIEAAQKTVYLHPDGTLETILKHHKDFCGDMQLEDDMTLLVLDFR